MERRDRGAIVNVRFSVYHLVFDYLGRVYLDRPDLDFIGRLAVEDLFNHWPLAAADESAKKGLRLLQRFFGHWQPAHISALDRDYTGLFIGLETTLASPYESVYLSKDHLMFEKQTLAVRRCYQRSGLRAAKMGVEPDDHMGLELSFMAHLCRQEASAIKKEDNLRLNKILRLLDEFLTDHLLLWYIPFTDRVIRHARTDYYRGHAHLTRSCIESIAASMNRRGIL